MSTGICRFAGCGREVHSKAMCNTHYARIWNGWTEEEAAAPIGSRPIRSPLVRLCLKLGLDVPTARREAEETWAASKAQECAS